MHICFLVDHFPVRSETFVRDQAVGLRRRGHRVTVLTRGAGSGIASSEVAELQQFGIELVFECPPGGGRWKRLGTLASSLVRSPAMARWIQPRRPWRRSEMFDADHRRRAVEALRPDVLHIHFGHLARPLHRLGYDGPSVASWYGFDANVLPRRHGDAMYGSLFQGSWTHVALSGFLRERLLKLGGCDDSIRVIPLGIDPGVFVFGDRSPRPGEPLRVVSVGRLDEMKGHEWLIAAVVGLLDAGERVALRIVGDGPLRAALQEQIDQSGHGDAIELLGPLPSPAVAEELQAANVFALTGVVADNGRVETQGVVFAEAQACGLPVIGADVGGVPESMIPGETGRLCPPRDVQAIGAALRGFMQPGEIAAFGRRGRAFVEEKFAVETMLDRLESLYESVQSAGGCRG